MKILAIETSSVVASVAISEDKKILGEMTINHPQKHSQKLMPLIKNLFENLNFKIEDIDLIAVSNGPGSFTGIRIGLTTAKALAHKNNLPIVTFSTLESLARNVLYYDGIVISLGDARRKRVFMQEFQLKNGEILNSIEPNLTNVDEVLKGYNQKDEKILLIGSGVYENYNYIIENKNENIKVVTLEKNFPVAQSLCIMASAVSNDKYQSYESVNANYMRKSQAELSL